MTALPEAVRPARPARSFEEVSTNTQAPIVDPEAENGPTSITARTDTAERPAASISSVAASPAALLLLAGFVYSIYTFIIGAAMSDAGEPGGIARIIAGILLFLFVLILMTSLAVISPGQTSVCQFFRRYIGTVRRTDPILVSPLTDNKKVSVEVHNFEANELKVNNSDSSPVNIATIVVWQVVDTTRTIFTVKEYEEFTKAQIESALHYVTTTHPYNESGPDEISLRGGTGLVNAELAEKVANRVALAGLGIAKVRISSLAYAPRIV